MDPVGAEVFALQPAPLKAHLKTATEIEPKRYGLPSVDDVPGLDLRVRSYHRGLLGVMHDKFMVIDGREVLLGSKNVEGDICEEYMLHLDGSVANSLREQFKQAWGEEIPDLKSVTEPATSTDANTLAVATNPITAPRKDVKEFPVIVMGRIESKHALTKDEDSPEVAGWLTALNLAEKSIYIQTLNFCTKRVVDLVLELVQKKPGLTVTIVTSYSYQDIWEQLHRNSYGSDVQVAKRMYEKLPKEFHNRLNVCWWMGSRIEGDKPVPSKNEWTHTKAMLIDDEIAIIGSANMDPSSWYHQHEFNIAIDDPTTTGLIRDKLFANQKSLPPNCYHGTDYPEPNEKSTLQKLGALKDKVKNRVEGKVKKIWKKLKGVRRSRKEQLYDKDLVDQEKYQEMVKKQKD